MRPVKMNGVERYEYRGVLCQIMGLRPSDLFRGLYRLHANRQQIFQAIRGMTACGKIIQTCRER